MMSKFLEREGVKFFTFVTIFHVSIILRGFSPNLIHLRKFTFFGTYIPITYLMLPFQVEVWFLRLQHCKNVYLSLWFKLTAQFTTCTDSM